jgi:hypothetical protein
MLFSRPSKICTTEFGSSTICLPISLPFFRFGAGGLLAGESAGEEGDWEQDQELEISGFTPLSRGKQPATLTIFIWKNRQNTCAQTREQTRSGGAWNRDTKGAKRQARSAKREAGSGKGENGLRDHLTWAVKN